jgi:hypothetical protein
MARLFILLFLIDLALAVVALIDCLSTDEYEIRALPKVAWAFIVVLFSPIGPIAWFFAGRPQKVTPGGPPSWHPAGSANGSRRQVAPDDDPEFLRGLASRTRRDDEELLRQWEADLRRREDELRQDKPNGDEEQPAP